MPYEEIGYVHSLLMKDHTYETNLNTIEENGQTTGLYKMRLHFNDLHYDLCVAIGDIKSLENVDYKYVYVVKYGSVVSKLGLYEFVRGSNNNVYKEGSMLIFDNFANTLKLNDLLQTKEEYIIEKNKKNNLYDNIKKNIKPDKIPFEEKYKVAIKRLNEKYPRDSKLFISSIKFYDTHGVIDFIKDNKLDNELINTYKEKYESMSYNDFMRMVFVNKLELLEELEEFEDTNEVVANKQNASPNEFVANKQNASPNEVVDNEADEKNEFVDNEADEKNEDVENEDVANEADEKNEAEIPNEDVENEAEIPNEDVPNEDVTNSPLNMSPLSSNSNDNKKGGKMKLLKRKMRL